MKAKYRKVPLEVSIHLRYHYQQQNLSGTELCKKYLMYSTASIYRHAKKPVHAEEHYDKRGLNKGRPHKLTKRDHRALRYQNFEIVLVHLQLRDYA